MSDSTPQSVENTTTSDTEAGQAKSRVECPPAKDPGVRLLIAAGLLLAMGIYCIIDIARGEYGYVHPSENLNKFGSWLFNFAGQFVFTIPGLIAMVWAYLYFKHRTCVADEQGLHYAYFKKEPVAWSEIEKIDASKLKADRILVVHAKDGREVKLDSWKLENFKALVVFIEQHVPAEKIKA